MKIKGFPEISIEISGSTPPEIQRVTSGELHFFELVMDRDRENLGGDPEISIEISGSLPTSPTRRGRDPENPKCKNAVNNSKNAISFLRIGSQHKSGPQNPKNGDPENLKM